MLRQTFFYVSFAFLIALFVVALTQPEHLRFDSPSALASTSTTAEAQTSQMSSVFSEADALLENELNTIDIVNQFGPGIAAINVSVQGQAMRPFRNIPADQLPAQFRDLMPFLDEAPTRESSGSGFLIDADGTPFLVSNFHVVQPALVPFTTDFRDGAGITAAFPGQGAPIPVKVVGVNPSFDLALLSVLDENQDYPDVPTLKIADSDAVQVGQKAIAIGNPFGLEFTVTTGIISAVGRFVPSVGQVPIPMLQTDAAVNPGNSGGPLLNSQGELIGVNTSILNPEGRSSAGLGFAVPSNLLLEALANLELGGVSDISLTRPFLGTQLRTISLLPEGLRELLDLPEEGVLVMDLLPGSPADKAGLQASDQVVRLDSLELHTGGDIITAVEGIPLASAEQLNLLITYEGQAGDDLELTILRDGVEMVVSVTLAIMEP